MKKITVLSMGMCAVLALASCGTSKESAYKKAYEKAQQQEQQAAQAPVALNQLLLLLRHRLLLMSRQRLITQPYVLRMFLLSQVLVCLTTA